MIETKPFNPFKVGDPRLPKSDMDSWLATVLEARTESGTPRPYLYGSDAGFCARRNVLLEHNVWVDSNVNSAGKGYMAIGVAFENLLAESLQKLGRLLTQDFRLVLIPEVKISGKIDLIVIDSQGELALVEVKTCGELPSEIKPNHLAQVQTYCAVSGFKRAWVIYLSRNLSPRKPMQTRTFQVDTSREAMVSRLTTAVVSRAASDLKMLPPQPAGFRKHTECHYCEFRDYFCWEARPGLKAKPMTEEDLARMTAQDPLYELPTEDYITLHQGAKVLALALYDNSPYRYLQTLELLHAMSLTENQRTILEHEMDNARFSILNPLSV